MLVAQADSDPQFEHLTRRVQNGSVELHCEEYRQGNFQASAPMLLLSEAEAPSSRWPDELLTALVEQYGRVIWFDTRDTGRSSWPLDPYSMDDLAGDVLAVLDAHGVGAAHLFGRSMGGQVAQAVALTAPERVASMVLMSTTPGRREELGLPEEWLIEKMSERFLQEPPGDPTGRAEWIVDQLEWFAGPAFAFDRDERLAAVAEESANYWRGPNAHGVAVIEAPDILDELAQLTMPVTIIHGTADPVLPVAHATALNDAIPGSTLHLIEGLGHDLPAAVMPQILRCCA